MIRLAFLLAALLAAPAEAAPPPHWPAPHVLRLYPRTYPFHAVCRGDYYVDRNGRVRCRRRIG